MFSQSSDVPVRYRRMLSLALIASVLAWRILLRRPLAARRVDGATRAGAAIASLLMLLMLTLPYRLMFHSARPVVRHGDLKCYALGVRGNDRLVYCPAWDAPHIRTLTAGRDEIVDTGVRENLFTPP